MKKKNTKVLLVRGMTEEIMISISIDESFLYHLEKGIQAMKALSLHEGFSHSNLSTGLESLTSVQAYKLKKEHWGEGLQYSKYDLKYLLLDNYNKEYIVHDGENVSLNYKVVEYNDDYYDQREYDELFESFEDYKLKQATKSLLIYDGYFSFHFWDIDSNFFSEHIPYDVFAKQTENDFNSDYRPPEKGLTMNDLLRDIKKKNQI